jgi:amino acid adenylation domain-containing protein
MNELSGVPFKLSQEQKVTKDFEQSIPDCFEEHVRKHPERLAFKSKKAALTWDALNRTANRVARAILGMCESRERPIALLLDQEASMMPATVGVLKAGGFYVPLSPSHPRVRNSYILNNTEATLIVTDSSSFSLATELAERNCHLLNIDDLDSSLPSENLGLPISADSLAFLTYTSGSTAEPKGVINTHRKALYRITHDKLFGLGPDDRFTQPSSAERRTPFAALLSGAGSFPWYVKEEGLAHLADWLIQEEITVYRSAPRVFRHFVSTLTGKEEFPKLRVIVLAGEAVHKTDFELYKKHFSSDCLLINAYGAHEVGPIRMYVVGKETRIAGEKVPIGYEIPDREVLLLDDSGQEVGFSQVGEIAVRTRDISPSFWRRPELTDAKFLPDPNDAGRRIYLTGDLGRMLPDGCLEHLGRKDFQVKIRGLRVEIDEVEGALRSLVSIREAVVIAQEDKPGDKRLVAYIVAAGNAALSVSEVRRFAEQKLPPLMVPSRFVVLNALPLTPTGKVNRRDLPDPGNSRPELDIPFVAPRTPVEQELSQIWAKILALEQVGIHDSFIELGGHSLTATQVISQVMKKFQVEIPLRSLFGAPTIAKMAAVITEHQGKQLGEKELERMLGELELMSDEEARHLVAKATISK